MNSAASGAIAGGIVSIVVTLLMKKYEFQKRHDAIIAEKKRDVYKRLLEPWASVIAHLNKGKKGDEMFEGVEMSRFYESAFDAALYGSEEVLQHYAAFKTTDADVDEIDRIRNLAKLLIAMRVDVTGKRSNISHDAVLRTFINFKPEELILLQLREYVEKNPAAQAIVRDLISCEQDGAAADQRDETSTT